MLKIIFLVQSNELVHFLQKRKVKEEDYTERARVREREIRSHEACTIKTWL